ncbi:biotin--[acetyl-CoA-carboxylase] ligase [Gudongella oleilytica]|jgi:BirA family biotin operon repressor/biotin-[acetyl-CoA-carboxylase] ligase|uniref:biotin--[acetyl-CoA-carboxylase] ligase n=1 Tax=Gudongella oleilytica TaxID=1582259 RepID=UPI000FF8B624|nr:biotin--[acetyl-CoA-carboxylase] ligase [Gudongella oleilytica]
MKHKIIDRLHEEEGFISGEKLSEEFGLSRTAIWKHVNALREDGYEIESVTRRGYRLISSPDIINYDEIKGELTASVIGKKLIYFQSIGSTNDKAKELAAKAEEGTVIVAEEQTSGKGRLGRSWSSPGRKGIYASIILKPDMEPFNAAKLTLLGAASVALALEDCGIESQIKWPNDIIIGGKKVAGILTEMSCELGIVNYIILGIGINVNQSVEELPPELVDKATSLRIAEGKAIKRKHLLAQVLNRLDELYVQLKVTGDIEQALDICRERSAVIGKDIIVVQGRKQRPGHAVSINHDGELMVRFDEGLEQVISGEVSIRTEYGYV